MKNLSKKILIGIFLGFLSLSLLLTALFNYDGIVSSLYENKAQLFQYSRTFSTISSALSKNLIFLSRYANLYGGLQRVQGKEIWTDAAGNTYLIGGDGKIYDFSVASATDSGNDLSIDDWKRLEACANALSELAQEANDRGAELIFVQAPARYDPDYVTLPLSRSSISAKTVDALEELLKENEDVHSLNLQRYFHEQEIPFDTWFYKTDHHWTTQMAFLAYQKLCEVINGEMGIEIDPFFYATESWESELFENAFLGSFGEKVGRGFVGNDSLELFFPKFETEYQMTSSGDPYTSIEKKPGITVNGTFTETALNMSTATYSYGSYLGGDICEVRLFNSKAATDKKVLIIKDSFAKPVAAFLSTCFAETRCLDLRYYKDGIQNYLDSYQPDLVVVLYNPTVYSDNFFSFE